MPKNNSIQIRRGSNSEWISANPILASGEPALETDTLRFKIGDGSSVWSGLNYIGNKEQLTLVKNDTGSTIYAGQTLYVSGIYNNSIPSVAKYVANGSISENLFIGLASSDISNNNTGYAISFGQIDNLNTVGSATNNLSLFGESSWTNGTLLYAHPTSSGRLTSTPPTRAISIGSVIYANGTQGKIFVKLKTQGVIDDLYDVSTSSASANQYLSYNGSSWVPTSGGIFDSVTSNQASFSSTVLIGDVSNYGSLTIGYSDVGNLARFARISNNPRIDLNGTVYFGAPAGGDPVIIASNAYNGTRGAITSGVWRGDIIEIDKGGTGRASYSNGQLLIGSGTSLVANTLTVTSGIGITNGSGTITIGVTGIPSSTITNFNSSVSGLLPTGTANYLSKFGTNGNGLSNSLIFDNGTNVGIGTTNPSERLEISGSLKFDSCAARILRGDNNNIRLSSGGSALGHFGIYIDNTGTTNGRVFRVASWADGTTGKFIIRDDSAGADRLVIQANGFVGIGTDVPTERLHVSGSQTTIRLNNSLSYDTQLRLTDTVSDWSVGINQGNGLGSGVFSIRSVTAGSSRLVIDTNGNVGIGTVSPGYKLQVNGGFGATTKSFRIDHPSKPGWNLEYGSLESPYHGVRLTGRDKVVKGVGNVQLPDYLKDLIHNDHSITIQLTNYKHGKTLYISNIDLKNNRFTVKADRAKTLGELEFFWTLTGVRKDVPDLVVEKEN